MTELTIQQRLRMRAAAGEDKLLDCLAADHIDRLERELDAAEAARAGDQQYLFHLERKIAEFSRTLAGGSTSATLRELVALMLRSTPSMSEPEAIDIIQKAAAKVFNREYESWPRPKPPAP